MADRIEADQVTVQAADPKCEVETEAGTLVAYFRDRAGIDPQPCGKDGGRPPGACQVGQQPGCFS
ncbi:hypothetical protein ACIHFC_29795 [Streptomyces sp. NPDC052013]|uniref:hypothetical protein n=1 Tax=Streptomyces sp. NPDC052013 TaxID=3365679 RepID=UPI0037D3E3D1